MNLNERAKQIELKKEKLKTMKLEIKAEINDVLSKSETIISLVLVSSTVLYILRSKKFAFPRTSIKKIFPKLLQNIGGRKI